MTETTPEFPKRNVAGKRRAFNFFGVFQEALKVTLSVAMQVPVRRVERDRYARHKSGFLKHARQNCEAVHSACTALDPSSGMVGRANKAARYVDNP